MFYTYTPFLLEIGEASSLEEGFREEKGKYTLGTH